MDKTGPATGWTPAPTRKRRCVPLNLPKRKQIRLPDYDYSSPGAYFVTICTADRRCILSDITVGAGVQPMAGPERPTLAIRGDRRRNAARN